jgi:hypothetical protein
VLKCAALEIGKGPPRFQSIVSMLSIALNDERHCGDPRRLRRDFRHLCSILKGQGALHDSETAMATVFEQGAQAHAKGAASTKARP